MAEPTLRFVALEEAHLARVLEIENEANGAPWSERSFRHEIGDPNGPFRVALVGGEVAGYGGAWNLVDEAHVTTLAVAAEHRRKGIGRKLMRRVLEDAKDAGMLCATLEVRAGNDAAIKLYESLGFDRRAVRKKYYPDNGEDAVIMWRDEL